MRRRPVWKLLGTGAESDHPGAEQSGDSWRVKRGGALWLPQAPKVRTDSFGRKDRPNLGPAFARESQHPGPNFHASDS